MVTLGPRQKVENPRRELIDQVNRQVDEIIEAAAKPTQKPPPETASWTYSMPFAGVRYYRYHQ